jgi:hypothetical protein
VLTFEEQKAKFPEVPDYVPDPNPKQGAGRKKKPQRFWAPENADGKVLSKFGELQSADEDVRRAEVKLAANQDARKTKHYQAIVLRNMQKRHDLWVQAGRLQQGLSATEGTLQDAEGEWKKHYEAFAAQNARLEARQAELREQYPGTEPADDYIDLQRLDKKQREGLQTMKNWTNHKSKNLLQAYWGICKAHNREYGEIRGKADLHVRAERIHALGGIDQWCFFNWLPLCPLHTALREEFSNPDSSTWGSEGPIYDNNPANPLPVASGSQRPPSQDNGSPRKRKRSVVSTAPLEEENQLVEQNLQIVGDWLKGLPEFQAEDAQAAEPPRANLEPFDGTGCIDPALLTLVQPDQEQHPEHSQRWLEKQPATQPEPAQEPFDTGLIDPALLTLVQSDQEPKPKHQRVERRARVLGEEWIAEQEKAAEANPAGVRGLGWVEARMYRDDYSDRIDYLSEHLFDSDSKFEEADVDAPHLYDVDASGEDDDSLFGGP